MRRKVAILGGGMGGLSAAWELSAGDWTKRFDRITVYERGARLGGKAASSRGAFGRIEEHGLHVWMGYYDNAFRLIRECYDELDRARTDPTCPIATWRDAFEPTVRLGVADGDRHWIPDLPPNDRLPGDGDGDSDDELVPQLLGAAGAALRSIGAPPRRGLVLSASPHPPARRDAEPWVDDVAALARDLESGAVGAIGATLTRLASLPAATAMDVLAPNVRALRSLVAARLATDRAARRSAEVIEMLLVMATGLAADGIIGTDQLGRLDGESGRAWLARHGASAAVIDGPMMRGFHDLVFGYEHGDPSRPTFPAGLGVALMRRMFFGYKGSLAWRMRAGMGDVVIAPLYQALCRRGVQFRFFHDVEALRPSPDGSTVDRIDITVQAEPGGDPLTRVHDLPVFPVEPDELDRRCRRRTSLARGVDFDVAVLAIPVGALGRCAADLVSADERWQAMVTGMSTVATQSLQVWLRPDEASLGWPDPGAVVAGGGKPFDTYASMSHLLPMEAWPSSAPPQSLGYFCSVLPDAPGGPAAACARVGANAAEYLATRARSHWPGLEGDDVIAQHWTANVDPSDRYVQATPASSGLRLAPDRSGYENLVLAGDWTDSGLNAGCIEAAVLSGVQAAAALTEDVHRELGGWR